MVGIEEPIDLLPLPADVPAERKTHGVSDSARGVHAQSLDLTALEQATHAWSYARRCGEVDESPAALVASRANGHPETPIIHARMVTGGPLPAT